MNMLLVIFGAVSFVALAPVLGFFAAVVSGVVFSVPVINKLRAFS